MRPALQIHFQLLASPEAAAVSRKTVQVTKVWEELATESLHGPLAKHERKCGKRHHGFAGMTEEMCRRRCTWSRVGGTTVKCGAGVRPLLQYRSI